ncbi:MAG TPA: glycogen debranching N-terminal domain-containing protein, partial [Chroococcales cyanobacterium]
RPVLAGAAYGAVLTPSENSGGSGNFFAQRAVSGLVGGATFGTLKAATIGLTGGAALAGVPVADAAFQKSLTGIGTRLSINMLAGGAAGFVNGESTSLLHGNGLASTSDLANSVGAFVVTGGALDVLHMVGSGERSSKGSAQSPDQVQDQTGTPAESVQPGGGSGHMMDVQARMTEDFSGSKGNSPELLASADALKQTVGERLSATIADPSQLSAQKAQFDSLVDGLAVREYDGVGMNKQHLIETYGAVNRLLSSQNTVVDLSAQDRLALAKQILSEATTPYSSQVGANNTEEAQGVQSLLFDRVPGKIANGIVDLVTTGKYSSNRAEPVNVDLSPENLQSLPLSHRAVLAPDSQAQASLANAWQANGTLVSEGQRTYASQLAQTLLNNIHAQGQAAGDETVVYTKGSPDQSIDGDTGERLFQIKGDGSASLVENGGIPQNGANLATPDLQPLFDHVSGVDNDSLVLKNNNYFMVMNPEGAITGNQGDAMSRFGLYGNDMRFLSNWDLKVNGQSPEFQAADLSKGYAGKFDYQPAESVAGGVSLSRDIVINNGVGERLTVQNNTDMPQTVHLSYGFGSDFRDMFEVRGWQRAQRGETFAPVVSADGGKVLLSYNGLDGSTYSTEVGVNGNGAGVSLAKDGVHFTVSLPAGASHSVELSAEPSVDGDGSVDSQLQPFATRLAEADANYESWRNSTATVTTGNEDFNRMMDRAYRDLYMLKIQTPRGDGIAAGIPWYVAGFGRDQLITAMQSLPFMPELSRGVIEQLANYQGTKENPTTAEKPGKIMHELRAGEMAKNGEIPFTPYYGTVDATPLWLTLLGRYVDTTGDTDFARQMQPHVDAALKYLDAETARNGYLSYGGNGREALSNQGWKDSGDSIMHKDGSLITAPISLSEPQGYLYTAWRSAARLAAVNGDTQKAADLNARADDLKVRFNRDFWMPDQEFAALALDGNGQQAQVISSNPGHLLSTGLLTPEHALAVEQRLMQDDMFSGYGIRTLSSNEVRYNPGSYHDGTVWPHDNGMIGEGIHDLVPRSGDDNRLML